MALAAGAVLAPKVKHNTVVAISMTETRKRPPKPEAPPPLPPLPLPDKAKVAPARTAAAKPAPAIPDVSPPPPSSNVDPGAFADLGLTMGNGAGGLAVPVAARPAPTARSLETTHTVRALAALAPDSCAEPVVKAKLRGTLVKPAYTDQARTALVEGVVRVEMTVDDVGTVGAVKVLKGLGYGLDEAALTAAKQMTFEPGTRCGKATTTKLTVGMRFSLQQ